MGARAFSHDSIFIPDGGAESEQTVQAMSQDSILGKVKTLQVRQLETGGFESEAPTPRPQTPHPRTPTPVLCGGVWESPWLVPE